MKKSMIVSVRHGKTNSEADAGSDAARSLTEGGIAGVQGLGDQLRRRGFVPDRVIVSAAGRAKQSALLILNVIDPDGAFPELREKMRVVEGLYQWDEMTAAAKAPEEGGLGFQLHLAAYKEGFGTDLENFETNRVNALLEANGDEPIGKDENVLIVTHAWVANTSLFPFVEEEGKDELRLIGLPEAHALVLNGNGLECLGPVGPVELESLKLQTT